MGIPFSFTTLVNFLKDKEFLRNLKNSMMLNGNCFFPEWESALLLLGFHLLVKLAENHKTSTAVDPNKKNRVFDTNLKKAS